MSEEEIDIIELLKRIKEGKAPKRIELDGRKYYLYEEADWLEEYYLEENTNLKLYFQALSLNSKIKILDKPIIEELDIKLDDTWAHNLYMFQIKINEIIKHINKEEKKI